MLGKIYDIVSNALDGERVNVNYLNENEPSYAIKPVSDVKIREYLGDMHLKKFTFEIWYMSFYGDDATENLKSIQKLNDLAKKLELYTDDSYPFFAIEFENAPQMAREGFSMARYKVKMSVTYAV